MDNTDWFNYGGVFRDISLIRLPEAYVRISEYRFGRMGILTRSVPLSGLRMSAPMRMGTGKAV